MSELISNQQFNGAQVTMPEGATYRKCLFEDCDIIVNDLPSLIDCCFENCSLDTSKVTSLGQVQGNYFEKCKMNTDVLLSIGSKGFLFIT